MNYFVFRNNTVERFFPKEYSFSGYQDISNIPADVDGYVWFYQLPVKYDLNRLAEEVNGYADGFEFVMNRIEGNKMVVALTMEIIYSVPFTDNDFALENAVAHYNNILRQAAEAHPNLKIVNFREFTSRYQMQDLMDWKFYFISQMALNPRLSSDFKNWWNTKLDSMALKRKKCLVLDLDNTLWGGVLGEEGIDGIKIGGDYPGKAFLYFQEALLELSKSGVILTICSKNNEQDVFDAWEKNPYLVLKKDHFSAWRINWNDKATSIRELSEELNIGLDSFVFIDDNPTERELIHQVLPMVEVPEFPAQPYELPLFFQKLVTDFFRVYSVTEEDKKKTDQYKANAARSQARREFADFSKYLESLDMHITLESANEFNIPRIAQMTQKTNQFNLTTKRYTDADIRQQLADGWKIWCISVADRFGDNGITGCIIVNGTEIDSFLLSCRILGKGIEVAFAKSVLALLKDSGVKMLSAKYYPTAKNAQVKEFYDKCGFTLLADSGIRSYEMNLANADLRVENYYHLVIK